MDGFGNKVFSCPVFTKYKYIGIGRGYFLKLKEKFFHHHAFPNNFPRTDFKRFVLWFLSLFFIGKFLKSLDDLLVFPRLDRKSTRLNSSHVKISYAVFCLKKKIKK